MDKEPNTYVAPTEQCVQAQNIRIGRLFVKVGILDTVASIGQGQTHRVRTKLFDAFTECQRVPLALRHLLSIEHQVSVRADAQGPLVLWEDGDVIVQCERQVVLYQVLARRPHVKGVEVVEFVLHRVGFLFRQGFRAWPRTVAKDVFPDLVGHLFSFHTQRAGGVSGDVAICFGQSGEIKSDTR